MKTGWGGGRPVISAQHFPCPLVGESPFGGQTDPLGPASSFARRRNKIMVKASAMIWSLVPSAILLAPLELTIGHQERGNIIEIVLTHVFEFTTWF